MPADWPAYLRELHEVRGHREATPELSLRPALITLARALAPAGVTAFPEAGSDVGQPDLIAKHASLVVGYGETKAPGTMRELVRVLDSPQLLAYRQLPNLLLTDYLHFLLLRDGVEVARATLIPAADLDAGRFGAATPGPAAELVSTWLSAAPVEITSALRLAEEMARRARWLREGIRVELGREAPDTSGGPEGPLRSLHHFYVENLMSDMDEAMFADAYAQTVAYGLFVARYHSIGSPFDRRTAIEAIPTSTAFLRSAVRLLLDDTTVPAGVRWIVDDLVALLAATSDALIARAGTVRGSGDDAVIYFYEHFLDAYDAGERADRGVFYTYPPLVSYTVRAVDDVLVRDFGMDGLADPRLRLLDPATGTGTFLVSAAEHAIQRVVRRDGPAVVPALIREHLLPHLYGFELLPAPYAIAHLKLGSFYAQAGHEPGAGERVRVYLTNTLAAPLNPATARLPLIGDLIAETSSADTVKRDTPLLVIVGNPPYSISSHNKEHLVDLMRDFVATDGRREQNVRPLDDDYLRFLRWSVWKLLEQAGAPGRGVIALITNRSFLSGPVTRGVRGFLLAHFDEIRVLDLHGNQRQWFRDRADEKVFPDVQSGIAITVLIRKGGELTRPATLHYRETRGTRETKFTYLAAATMDDGGWMPVAPRAGMLSFLPRDHDANYDEWPSLADLMPVSAPGVISHRDQLAVGFGPADLMAKVRAFADIAIPDEEIKERFALEDNDRWVLARRRRNLGGHADEALVKELHFRPFDRRVIYDHTDVVGDRRERIRAHLDRVPGNLVLIAARRSSAEAPYAFVSRAPATQAVMSSRTLGAAKLYPLLTVPATGHDELLPLAPHEQEPELNIAPAWRERLARAYGPRFAPDTFVGFAYGVLTSASFRERFEGPLEEDHPRIPFPVDVDLFDMIASEGLRLVRAHLGEEPGLVGPRLLGTGDLVVGEARYEDPRLWINATQYLDPVPPSVWTAKVGGYAPLPLWLRNRRGRQLSMGEVRELSTIVASIALGETLKPGIDAFVQDLLEAETL